jgi:hypothetical protein
MAAGSNGEVDRGTRQLLFGAESLMNQVVAATSVAHLYIDSQQIKH